MWLPYTDSVISVTSKPASAGVKTKAAVTAGDVTEKPTKAFCNLVKKLYFTPEISSDGGTSSIEHEHHPHPSISTLERLSFTQLRDLLLGTVCMSMIILILLTLTYNVNVCTYICRLRSIRHQSNKKCQRSGIFLLEGDRRLRRTQYKSRK